MESLRAQLERVYDESRKQFFACALAVTSCSGLAEDAVHNAFSRAFKLTKQPDNLRAYMMRSVRNAAIDLMRRENRTVSITPEMIFECAPQHENQAERNDILAEVSKALETLSENERETVVQHLVGDLTFQVIADMRERPMGTVTSWYRRGIKKLQEALKAEFRPDGTDS